MTVTKSRVQELLERARASLAASESAAKAAADELLAGVQRADAVDVSKLGITPQLLATEAGKEQAVDIMRDVIDNAAKAAAEATTEQSLAASAAPAEAPTTGVAANVTLNALQQAVCDAFIGTEEIPAHDMVMVGAAGTGKTTATGQTTKRMMDTGKVRNLTSSTKWLMSGAPGIAVLSYTRKAVNNIRKAVDDRIKAHTLTIHKIIEFGPVWYEVEDPEHPGEFKKTMRFEPKRNANNPLPPELTRVVFEESSMIQVELHQQFREAMPHKWQVLYIGDIQQLPPIFGSSILGFKMLELPVVELTEVYRQALESPIINLAWKLLGGNPHDFSSKSEKYQQFSQVLNREVTRFRYPALNAYNVQALSGEVKFQVWQKKLSADHGLLTATKQFCVWSDQGYYNPQDDIILCPFNKAFGTIELNKGISQHLGHLREAVVNEVIAGFNKYYLAVGDRVLYDKEDAFITNIAHSSEYLGKRPMLASKNLDRWGHYREKLTDNEVLEGQAADEEMNVEAIQNFMQSAVDDIEDRTQVASHVVTIRFAYSDEEIELSKSADINNLLGGYAITVHKAQGSEWERVFFVMHNTHAVMCSRELLYTAVTRARTFLHVICEPETFEKGIKSQRITGNTIAEKAEFFKGKYDEYIAKTAMAEPDPDVEFKAAEYKGDSKPEAIVMPEVTTPSVPLVRMADLVPQHLKDRAEAGLTKYWEKALQIWGARIGARPRLDYNLQFREKLGTANASTGVIKLNPVWVMLVEDNEECAKEMFDITIGHEVAHIVDGRFSDGTGHNSGWVMAMKLLGLPPDRVYTGNGLPDWMEGYRGLAQKKREVIAADLHADTFTTEYAEQGEE